MSIFLIWRSYELTGPLSELEGVGWFGQLMSALVVNIFVTGIFAFAGFALPTEKLMPSNYYQIHHPKRLKKWYKKLGVESFRKFLLATFWKKKEQQQKFFNGKISGLRVFEIQTKKAEFGHLLPFILISLISIYFVLLQKWWIFLFTLLVNIIFNFYPILLQRHHRHRLSRLKKIMVRKK